MRKPKNNVNLFSISVYECQGWLIYSLKIIFLFEYVVAGLSAPSAADCPIHTREYHGYICTVPYFPYSDFNIANVFSDVFKCCASQKMYIKNIIYIFLLHVIYYMIRLYFVIRCCFYLGQWSVGIVVI